MSTYGNDSFIDTEEQRFPTSKNYSPFCDYNDVDYDRPLDDTEAMPHFCEDNDPRQSQPITLRSRSQSRPPVPTVVDQLQLEVSVMLSNRVASDAITVRDCNSSGIYVGQLFSTKERLHTELSIVAVREKFEFKVDRSTNIC